MVDIAKPNFSNALWASGGSIVAPSDVKIATGWTAEVPPFQWENYSQNRQDQGIAHILQHGISVWDTLTEYQAGKSYVQGSDGLLYKARTTNINQDPVADVTFVNWTKAARGGLLAVQVFSTAGTFAYTPTPGTTSILAKVQAAAGGSGGVAATGAGQVAAAYGGQAGTYAEGRFTSGFTGLSVVVGAGGTGGATGANAGASGGSSSIGGLISAPGGAGGAGGTANTAGNSFGVQIGNSGTPSGANILTVLGRGSRGPSVFSTGQAIGGEGGDSFFGPGAPAKQGGQGAAATNPGSGSAGAAVGQSSGTSYPGTNSPAGIVIIYEYA